MSRVKGRNGSVLSSKFLLGLTFAVGAVSATAQSIGPTWSIDLQPVHVGDDPNRRSHLYPITPALAPIETSGLGAEAPRFDDIRISDDGKAFIATLSSPDFIGASPLDPPDSVWWSGIDVVYATRESVYSDRPYLAYSSRGPGFCSPSALPFVKLHPDGSRFLVNAREARRSGGQCLSTRDTVLEVHMYRANRLTELATGGERVAASENLDRVVTLHLPADPGAQRLCRLDRALGLSDCGGRQFWLNNGDSIDDAAIALSPGGEALALARGEQVGHTDSRILPYIGADTRHLMPGYESYVYAGLSSVFRGRTQLGLGECASEACGQVLLSGAGVTVGGNHWFLYGPDPRRYEDRSSPYGRPLLLGVNASRSKSVFDPIIDGAGKTMSIGDLWALLQGGADATEQGFRDAAAKNFGLPSPALGIRPVPASVTVDSQESASAFCARYNSLCASFQPVAARGGLTLIGQIGRFGEVAVPDGHSHFVHLRWNGATGGDVEARRVLTRGHYQSASASGRYILTAELLQDPSAQQDSKKARFHVYDAWAFPKIGLLRGSPSDGTGTGSSPGTDAGSPELAGPGGGCFIATAVFRSSEHPVVRRLRQFRDEHLLTNAPGRGFVDAYYRWSPPVADWLESKPIPSTLIAGLLKVFVAVLDGWLVVVTGLLAIAGLLLLLGLTRRRQIQARKFA